MERTLKAIRKKLKRTHFQIAALVGVVESMVSKVEGGKALPETRLDKWAAAYEMPLDEFLAIIEPLPLWRFATIETGFFKCTAKAERTVRSA